MTTLQHDHLDRVAPRVRRSNPVTPAQQAFADTLNGTIMPGVFSCCQIITRTHVYLVTRAGKVKFKGRKGG